VLDFGHKLVLRSVAQGDSDDSPALRNLVASGLVERRDDGSCAVTAAGRVALEDDAPTRWERITCSVLCVALGIPGVSAVVDWAS
jgi:hypothetical protein